MGKIINFTVLILSASILQLSAQNIDSIPIYRKQIKTDIPPSVKVKYLIKLCAHYWEVHPDSSLGYGWQGLPLLKKDVSPKLAGNLYFALGMAWENKGSFDSALWYLNKSRVIYDAIGELKNYNRSLEQIGSLFRINGQYDTAIVLMNQSLDYFRSVDNKFQIMSVLFNIGSSYLDKNRYNKALQYYLESASYDSVLQDTMAIATHLLGIGNIYQNLGDLYSPFYKEKAGGYYKLSQHYYKDCRNLFQKISNQTGYYFASMSLVSSYIGTGMFDQADSLLTQNTDILSYPDPRLSASFSVSKAAIMFYQGRKTEALTQLQKVAENKGEIRVLPEFHEAMLELSEHLRSNGAHDSAWRIAERTLKFARKNSIYSLAFKSLSIMAEYMKADGAKDRALELTREAMSYKDSLFVEIGKEIFDETEHKFKNQILKAEIQKLNVEGSLNHTKLVVSILAALVLLLILLIVIAFLLIRNKRANQMRVDAELKMQLAEQDKKLNESSLENMHLAMQLKEQELIYHTMQSANLIQTNRSIKDRLEDFQFRFQKKKDQDEFSQTLSDINRDAKQDPMAEFESIFRQIHRNFYEKLLQISGDLSKTELQTCALLRLNLSSKDIARVLNVSPASVDVTRSHIRKKLGLDQNQNLSGYLLQLAE